MEHARKQERSKIKTKLVSNQPYGEILDIADSEEVASHYTTLNTIQSGARINAVRGSFLSTRMRENHSDEEPNEEMETKPISSQAVATSAVMNQGTSRQLQSPVPVPPSLPIPPSQPRPSQSTSQGHQALAGVSQKPIKEVEREDDDEEEEGSDSSDEDDDDEDDDDNEHGVPLEGAYDPADYEHLPVSSEIKELFQYITRYTPQNIELEQKLKPFIPDFIPAVGDIDAFIKVPRPDGKTDTIGLTVLDEPCAKQSDPTVLDLQLRAISKQSNIKTTAVKSLENAEKNPKSIEDWVESISELHRSKPPPNVHYTKNMPNIDQLMQEWPVDFEELLKEVSIPPADLDIDLVQYIDIICALLDIPVYKSRIQSLHVLFTLYSEFKNSQHFKLLAKENNLDNVGDDAKVDSDQFIL